MPATSWPGGKRVAVVVTSPFETWADGTAPQYTVHATALRPGQVDYGGKKWSEYGGNVGVWRILGMLERCGVPATFAMNAKCAELYPDAAARILAERHEIAAHGYTQDQLQVYMTADEERAAIRRSLDVIEKQTGTRPRGWFSPVLSFTEHTHRIAAAEGLLYQGDASDIDLPAVVHPGGRPIVAFPATDFSDNRVLRASPRVLLDVYKDTFDHLYNHEPVSLIGLAIHCHAGGRPPIVAVFEQILRYFRSFPGVWFARAIDVAEYVRENGGVGESPAARLLGRGAGSRSSG
jgi:peptidoglycan/xylan/chitin deacetylase (PgdA/CDA1 family)